MADLCEHGTFKDICGICHRNSVINKQAAEIKRLRTALTALRDGCETRPVGTRYREDGQPSKHDKCIHGVWMYEDCGQCVSLFVEAALAQEKSNA